MKMLLFWTIFGNKNDLYRKFFGCAHTVTFFPFRLERNCIYSQSHLDVPSAIQHGSTAIMSGKPLFPFTSPRLNSHKISDCSPRRPMGRRRQRQTRRHPFCGRGCLREMCRREQCWAYDRGANRTRRRGDHLCVSFIAKWYVMLFFFCFSLRWMF
jgi:hypothetical protein